MQDFISTYLISDSTYLVLIIYVIALLAISVGVSLAMRFDERVIVTQPLLWDEVRAAFWKIEMKWPPFFIGTVFLGSLVWKVYLHETGDNPMGQWFVRIIVSVSFIFFTVALAYTKMMAVLVAYKRAIWLNQSPQVEGEIRMIEENRKDNIMYITLSNPTHYNNGERKEVRFMLPYPNNYHSIIKRAERILVFFEKPVPLDLNEDPQLPLSAFRIRHIISVDLK